MKVCFDIPDWMVIIIYLYCCGAVGLLLGTAIALLID